MPSSTSIYIGFDVGLARTGVAVANSLNRSARVAGSVVVNNGRHDWQAVDALIAEREPEAVILGNGSQHDPSLTKAINRLKSHLEQQHKLKVHLVDEALSTVNANRAMVDEDVGRSKRKSLRDQFAACIILESWLNSR